MPDGLYLSCICSLIPWMTLHDWMRTLVYVWTNVWIRSLSKWVRLWFHSYTDIPQTMNTAVTFHLMFQKQWTLLHYNDLSVLEMMSALLHSTEVYLTFHQVPKSVACANGVHKTPKHIIVSFVFKDFEVRLCLCQTAYLLSIPWEEPALLCLSKGVKAAVKIKPCFKPLDSEVLRKDKLCWLRGAKPSQMKSDTYLL